MSGHSNATQPARDLCDAVLAGLRSSVPEITRKENETWCDFHHREHNQFVHVRHQKESLLIFFLGDHEDEADTFPSHLGIRKRASIGTTRAKNTPFSLTLGNVANVAALCQLLIKYSYPKSLGGRKRKGVAFRPPWAVPEEILSSEIYDEGNVQKVLVNRYERDSKARNACIAKYGAVCSVCDFDFVLEFGEAMAGFIHVHHLKQLSTVGEGYAVDPIADLRPICPNCHAVIHRRQPPFSIEEVQSMRRPRLGLGSKQ